MEGRRERRKRGVEGEGDEEKEQEEEVPSGGVKREAVSKWIQNRERREVREEEERWSKENRASFCSHT